MRLFSRRTYDSGYVSPWFRGRLQLELLDLEFSIELCLRWLPTLYVWWRRRVLPSHRVFYEEQPDNVQDYTTQLTLGLQPLRFSLETARKRRERYLSGGPEGPAGNVSRG